jgi:ParB family transcriptional regulator, chromosome partitioning protein
MSTAGGAKPVNKRTALTEMVFGLAEKRNTAGERPAATDAPRITDAQVPASSAAGRGIVGRSLGQYSEAVEEKLRRIEREIAEARERGDSIIALTVDEVDDPLPPDRDPRAFADDAFAALTVSINTNGQDQPILVRRSPDGSGRYQLAAGRRRLAVCRNLGIPVLARVRPLTDTQMLEAQWRENAERQDVSLFERCRWIASLSDRQGLSTAQLATMMGVAQPTVVEWRKMGRLPEEMIECFDDPRQLGRNDAMRLHAAMRQGPAVSTDEAGTAGPDQDLLGRMVAAVGEEAGKGTRAQVAAALRSVANTPAPPSKSLVVARQDGRKLATLSRSGRQSLLRWDPTLDQRVIEEVARRLPGLVEEVESSLGTTRPPSGKKD